MAECKAVSRERTPPLWLLASLRVSPVLISAIYLICSPQPSRGQTTSSHCPQPLLTARTGWRMKQERRAGRNAQPWPVGNCVSEFPAKRGLSCSYQTLYSHARCLPLTPGPEIPGSPTCAFPVSSMPDRGRSPLTERGGDELPPSSAWQVSPSPLFLGLGLANPVERAPGLRTAALWEESRAAAQGWTQQGVTPASQSPRPETLF